MSPSLFDDQRVRMGASHGMLRCFFPARFPFACGGGSDFLSPGGAFPTARSAYLAEMEGVRG